MQSETQILLAPLQGFTDFHFRNIYHKCFRDVDKYYSPWIRLDGGGKLKNAQIRDVKPENNKGILLVPQIMCNKADDFLFLANYLYDLGYEEINWNLGCPYPMLTKRGLGSALLKTPEKIIEILDEVITKIPNKLSLKMRLGFEDPSESTLLLSQLNKYPLTEIIIHARTADQKYKGKVKLEDFGNCKKLTNHKIIYNGDITSFDSYKQIKQKFPQVKSWMIGRGLIANPFLAGMIKNESEELPENHKEEFRNFHDQLMHAYANHLSGDKHLLIKMSSFWEYFSSSFMDPHKAHKRIKKSKTMKAYYEAVKANFDIGLILQEY